MWVSERRRGRGRRPGAGPPAEGFCARASSEASERAVRGAKIQSAPAPERQSSPGAPHPLHHNGFRLPQRDTMVVLRSSLELHSRSTTSSATDSLDLSNEFLSLKDSGRRRPGSPRGAGKSLDSSAVSTGLGRGTLGPGVEPRRVGTGNPGGGEPACRAGVLEGSGETDLTGGGLSSWSPPLSTQEETRARRSRSGA